MVPQANGRVLCFCNELKVRVQVLHASDIFIHVRGMGIDCWWWKARIRPHETQATERIRLPKIKPQRVYSLIEIKNYTAYSIRKLYCAFCQHIQLRFTKRWFQRLGRSRRICWARHRRCQEIYFSQYLIQFQVTQADDLFCFKPMRLSICHFVLISR